MGISRAHLEARRKIIPCRIKVKIHQAQPRDAAPIVSEEIPAERRSMAISEVRSIDAAGKQATNQYCFFQTELGEIVLKEGDIIEDIDQGSFHTIESLSIELVGVRPKANCSLTVNPTRQVL